MSSDLTTTRGGDLPDKSELSTPQGSNSGFESDDEGYHKVEGKSVDDIDFDEANEEGLASVSGPPADSNMNVMSDDVHVSTASIAENLTDDDLTTDNLTDDTLGENVMANENYIQDQFGQLYRPVYAGEALHDDMLIYDNKYFTTEGIGNCQFCEGAGKVTVEKLGLKDCPDCDGTGDVQASMGDPMGEITPDPMAGQAPVEGAPDQLGEQPMQQQQVSQAPDQLTAQTQIPQQPMPQDPQQLQQSPPKPKTNQPPQQIPLQEEKKPNPFGEESAKLSLNENNDLIFDIAKGGNIQFKIAGETKLKIGDDGITKPVNFNTEKYMKHSDHRKDKGGRFTESDDSNGEPRSSFNDIESNNDIDDEIESKLRSKESCGCKKKAHEASVKKYEKFVDDKLTILKSHAKANEAVSLMYGLPTISKEGRKIKGTLAYAGVSLNDRIYLPEELKKGDGLTLPLLLNHSSTAGAEEELDRLSEEMRTALENEEDFQVGEVTLTWDPKKLTLFYEGVVTNEFFQTEIDEMNMAVSLGIFYDSDSPTVCDLNCYTMIKGAEFREVSLVYHAGFPIATIEAVEAKLKKASEDSLLKVDEEPEGTNVTVLDEWDKATEEIDQMPEGNIIDIEAVPAVESFDTTNNFSIRGVNEFRVTNMNGTTRYKLDENSFIHMNVGGGGASISGEEMKPTQLQPKMTTTPDVTKEIMKKPEFELEDGGKDIINDI